MMNQSIRTSVKSTSHRSAFQRPIFLGAVLMFAMVTLLSGASSAHAACGSPSALGLRAAAGLPMMMQAESEGESNSNAVSIVGLWHVVYKTGGAIFNETLDQWHSDGTEFENAFLPPAAGNICFGVWKPVGARTVRLHHVGWTFDATTTGTANGTFTLDETNTVSHDGHSYSGTFTFTTYTLAGVKGTVVKGTIQATRITVQ